MSHDADVIQTLGTMIKELLLDAVRLQRNARRNGDEASEQRIAAFIAAVSAAETACLRSDESAAAYALSRVDESRIH
ncbi:hypothetical protein [Roseospira visakhapatnamensis]|uniref:Uncharacterized protein n=1 Tax=Roseospira visakhapatnamensis TaxID=390880 RepID=A0A7W6RGU5_9PROT|nr:hypothetical protein [Roseospira visakhapatnamensis]MBB4268080.1 hypothetical protein [Roseospira visakhapatnamensis]